MIQTRDLQTLKASIFRLMVIFMPSADEVMFGIGIDIVLPIKMGVII